MLWLKKNQIHARCAEFWVGILALLVLGTAHAQGYAVKSGSAKVLGASGGVQVMLDGANEGTSVHVAQVLNQGSRVVVSPGGFVSLRLADGSLVRLFSNSNLKLESLPSARNAGAQASPTVLLLDKGSLDAEVVRKNAGGLGFEVRSPSAVAGVRGTRFGVTVQENGDFVGDVRRGRVAVNALGSQKSVELEAGRGVKVDPHFGLGESFALLPAVPDVPIAPLIIDETAFLQVAYASVPGALHYQFQISRDESMTQVIRNGLFEKPRALFAGVPSGKYFVAVRPVDQTGARGAEAIQPLQIKRKAAAPLLSIPASGPMLSEDAATVTCGHVEGASKYQIQVATDVDFKNKIVDLAGLPKCQASLPMHFSGDVYWRAAVTLSSAPTSAGRLPGAALQSAWSAPMRIELAPGLLKQAVLLGQDADPQNESARIRYRVQMATDSKFMNIVQDQLLASETLPLNVSPGQYYVRWKGVMPDQPESEFSMAQIVTVRNQ
jgi:hypothetical protein